MRKSLVLLLSLLLPFYACEKAPPARVKSGPCQAPFGGITWQGQKTFLYGINYPWRTFAGDFGGIQRWKRGGAAANIREHRRRLRKIKKETGVQFIRWWIWPDFRGDGVRFDSRGNPLGLGSRVPADLAAVLKLADELDLYLILTVFSFDNFYPTRNMGNIRVPSLRPILKSPVQRHALFEKVIRPLARQVASSPLHKRVLAWDLMNEPEWALRGKNPYGDEAYYPVKGVETVTHREMEVFLRGLGAVFRQESKALLTVGQAAFAWKNAWRKLNLDFYQFHIYHWTEKKWPHTDSPADRGLADKPVLIGELPMGPLKPGKDAKKGVPYDKVMNNLWRGGYAGAFTWSYASPLPRKARLGVMKKFSRRKGCRLKIK